MAVGDVDRRVPRIHVAGEVGEAGLNLCLGLSRPPARLIGKDVETLDGEAVRHSFIKIVTFRQKPFSSKPFSSNHFHQNPISPKKTLNPDFFTPEHP